jgi:hypothetical protein
MRSLLGCHQAIHKSRKINRIPRGNRGRLLSRPPDCSQEKNQPDRCQRTPHFPPPPRNDNVEIGTRIRFPQLRERHDRRQQHLEIWARKWGKRILVPILSHLGPTIEDYRMICDLPCRRDVNPAAQAGAIGSESHFKPLLPSIFPNRR